MGMQSVCVVMHGVCITRIKHFLARLTRTYPLHSMNLVRKCLVDGRPFNFLASCSKALSIVIIFIIPFMYIPRRS